MIDKVVIKVRGGKNYELCNTRRIGYIFGKYP